MGWHICPTTQRKERPCSLSSYNLIFPCEGQDGHGDAATCQLFGRFFCEMEMDLKSEEEERVRAMLFLLTDVGENGPAKRREDWRGRKGLNS